MPPKAKPGRVSRSVSFREDYLTRLDKEAEDRLISPNLLVEQGLTLLFAKMDAQKEVENASASHDK